MRAKWLVMTLLAGAVVGCGRGHAVLNVDLLSFLRPSGDDSIAYNVPGGVTADTTISQQFTLPGGLANSVVDSVLIRGAAELANRSGGGTVTLKIYFAKTQSALFSGAAYDSASSGHVTGLQTVPFVLPDSVSLNDTLFNTRSLWLGLRASITTDPPLLTPMVGTVRLTQLQAHIVVSDKLF